MPELLFDILLFSHIICGGMALITGLIALSTVKGGRVHRSAGKIFVIDMMIVSFSAFFISIAKHLDFLLAISIFSFYMNYTGYRVMKNRTGKFTWYDWIPVALSICTAIYMLISYKIVLVVFGIILTSFLFRDVRLQAQGEEAIKASRRAKVLTHISRMVGTYIATVTAFLVVNINFVRPGWILWLLPTALGTPFIFYWSRRWQIKLKLVS